MVRKPPRSVATIVFESLSYASAYAFTLYSDAGMTARFEPENVPLALQRQHPVPGQPRVPDRLLPAEHGADVHGQLRLPLG